MTMNEALAKRDLEMVAIQRAGDRASRRIAVAYRRLFPLSLLTVFVVGFNEYERRADRYESFARRVLKAQRAAIQTATR
jgi:hypothetical protein